MAPSQRRILPCNNNLLPGCSYSPSVFVSSWEKGMERLFKQLSFQAFKGTTVPRKVPLNPAPFCALLPHTHYDAVHVLSVTGGVPVTPSQPFCST